MRQGSSKLLTTYSFRGLEMLATVEGHTLCCSRLVYMQANIVDSKVNAVSATKG